LDLKLRQEGKESRIGLNNLINLLSNSDRSNNSILKLNGINGNKIKVNDNRDSNKTPFMKEKIKRQIKFCYEVLNPHNKRLLECWFFKNFFNKILYKSKTIEKYNKISSNWAIAEEIFNQTLEKFNVFFYLKIVINFKLVEQLIFNSNLRFLKHKLSEKEYFYQFNANETQYKLINTSHQGPES